MVYYKFINFFRSKCIKYFVYEKKKIEIKLLKIKSHNDVNAIAIYQICRVQEKITTTYLRYGHRVQRIL